MSRSDFDGDGFDDLANGVAGEAIGRVSRAGAANVLYGSLFGPTPSGDQFWHQDSSNVEGGAESFDRFGSSLASGDFDDDGFDDLAIGAPGEDIGTVDGAGAVNVLYGSRSGLTATGDQFAHQDSANVEGAAESGDRFGNALAVGDFDRDGFDDLAIGVFEENIGSITNAGAVNVLYGSRSGLTATGDQFAHQDSANVEGAAESGDRFGNALAVGDFDRDGFDDLAIGVFEENIGGITNAGAVNLLYGSAAGLTATGDQFAHQDSANVEGAAESGDRFGDALAIGDFDGDGFDDLAIGVPLEDIGRVENAGAVNLLYGSVAGLTAAGDQFAHQDSANVEGAVESGDRFGDALAVGDFDGDGFDDLAIGAPGENVGTGAGGGAVNVLYGSAAGLTASGDQFWHQNSADVEGLAENFDFFGDSLTVGDFDDDGFDDLAIGVPGEGIGTASGAGATNVLFGSTSGLTSSGDRLWHQDDTGVLGVAEAGDLFGFALT